MTYNFKATNTFLLFIRLSLVLAATLLVFTIVFTFGNLGRIKYEFLFLFCFLLVAFCFFYLTKKIIVIDIYACLLNKTKIEIELKYFLLRKKTYVVLIPEIRSYSYENGMGYKIFSLNRKKGFNFKFLVMPEIENLKSFEIFYEDLKNVIEKKNEENNLNFIYGKPTIYKTKFGLLCGAILLLILIAIPIAHLFFETKLNIGFLLILYPAGIMFLIRLYIEQKK